MRTLIAVCLVGLVTLSLGAQKASAWWLWDCLFNRHGCEHAGWTQYNAFSPFCCEGAGGCYPMAGHGHEGSPACLFSAGQGYLGELPAPGMIAGPIPSTPATQAANGGMAPYSAPFAPGQNPQAIQRGFPVQPGPAWGAGMMNPQGVPGFYPGLTNYGPASGIGAPPYNAGFPGYAPPTGFGRF